MSPRFRFLALAAVLILAGCSSAPPPQQEAKTKPVPSRGGYYLDDGPGDNPPADLAGIPDAVPKDEPLKASASRPYSVFGKDYAPLTRVGTYKERGLASWYGKRFHGKPTSSGEPYDMYAMSAAHKTLPIPSYARVTNLKNGRSVVVRINDRGPFHDGRIIDLSYTAAWKLDILKGVTPVEVVSIDPSSPPSTSLASADDGPDGIAPSADTAGRTAASDTFLQLGAFSSSTGADQLVRRLQDRFGERLPVVSTLRAGGYYKVRLGPFASLAEADQVAHQVEQETGIRAFKSTR
jgi:rare lipoprotein A